MLKIIFTILFLSSYSHADVWVSKADFLLRKAGSPNGTTSYKTKASCGLECFNTTDPRRWQIDFAPIDLSKIMNCDDSADCSTKIPNVFVCTEGVAKFDNKDNWPTVPGVGWFLWCETEILVQDAAGIAAADTEDAQISTDKTTRITAKGVREVSLQQCVQDSKNPTLSPQQIKDCLAALVREMLGSKIAIGDL